MTGDRAERPVHLLMIVNTLARGGSEAMTVRLALALDPKAVRPVVVCLKDGGALADSVVERFVPVHANLLKHKFDLRVVGRMCHLIEQYQPVCLMAVGSGGDRMFWGTLAARQMGVPMMVWFHCFPVAGHVSFEWSNRRLYKGVDAFVALGQRHRQALIDLEKVPPERVHVIRNGSVPTPFGTPEDRREARQRLGIDDDAAPVVGVVANLRPDKRHDHFVAAALRVRKERDQARFVIIGDGPERAKIERSVSAASANGTFVRMMGERSDVATLVHGLDIVCLTSEWQECLGIAMLEAMVAGKAFVAPRISSLDEALAHGVTGRFYHPPTPDALAEVLIELIDHPVERESLG